MPEPDFADFAVDAFFAAGFALREVVDDVFFDLDGAEVFFAPPLEAFFWPADLEPAVELEADDAALDRDVFAWLGFDFVEAPSAFADDVLVDREEAPLPLLAALFVDLPASPPGATTSAADDAAPAKAPLAAPESTSPSTSFALSARDATVLFNSVFFLAAISDFPLISRSLDF